MSFDAPRVTVAIPLYNSAATLERCVRSAMAQTLRDIEIIVADDCSTDGGAALADRLAAEDPRIAVLRLHANGGKPRAMNAVVAAARGDWVAVLDADDAYHPDRLRALVEAAEAAGVPMAADNIRYVDAGVNEVVRTAFDPASPLRTVGKADLIAHSDPYAAFDFGILKPVMRRDFLQRHSISYHEDARLSEDFYYLLQFFVAGGTGVVLPTPYYDWTMPFGTVSRRWTDTGAGAWRYDYRKALPSNEHFIAVMAAKGEHEVVRMLQARSRQYNVMIHYLDAQRFAHDGAWLRSAAAILGHPSTYRLLLGRIAGRIRRKLVPSALSPSGSSR